MSYACIFVADFPVQAIFRAEPNLRSFAVAVMDGTPPLEFVVAMNEFARKSGAQMDMPRSLLEHCPALLLRRRSPELETSAYAALLHVAQSFSPRVESTAADTLLLDLEGMDALFGGSQQIGAALKQRTAQSGLTARIAVAGNPDTAIAAARGFDGVTVIPNGREAEMLGGLPLTLLLPSAEILATLERWGIRDFRALASLPTAQLSERLGQAGVRLQKLARGRFVRALHCHETPAEFSEAMELEDAVEELEPLAFILSHLLNGICGRLRAHALATNEIRVQFDLHAAVGSFRQNAKEDSSEWRRKANDATPDSVFETTLRLPVPTCDSVLLLNLLRLSLAANPPQAPIEKVHITAAPSRLQTAQGGLFIPLGPEPQKMEVTLARIAAMVGAGNVGVAQLLDTHRPAAFCMRPFVATDLSRHALQKRIESWRPEAAATKSVALRMFRPAVAATVHLQGNIPARTFFGGVRGKVTAASGPWLTSGDWWQPGVWQHDDWDIELAIAGREAPGFYKIYFDRAADAWFVRGEYD